VRTIEEAWKQISLKEINKLHFQRKGARQRLRIIALIEEMEAEDKEIAIELLEILRNEKGDKGVAKKALKRVLRKHAGGLSLALLRLDDKGKDISWAYMKYSVAVILLLLLFNYLNVWQLDDVAEWAITKEGLESVCKNTLGLVPQRGMISVKEAQKTFSKWYRNAGCKPKEAENVLETFLNMVGWESGKKAADHVDTEGSEWDLGDTISGSGGKLTVGIRQNREQDGRAFIGAIAVAAVPFARHGKPSQQRRKRTSFISSID